MSSPKSLSVAYGVQRRNRSGKPNSRTADILDILDEGRANSVAEAILRKRRETSIEEDDEGLVDLKANDEESPASLLPRQREVVEEDPKLKAPVLKENFKAAGSVADAIRKKRKAKAE